jgi:hypothetical protein
LPGQKVSRSLIRYVVRLSCSFDLQITLLEYEGVAQWTITISSCRSSPSENIRSDLLGLAPLQVGADVVEQLQTALAEMGSENAKVVCLVRTF